MYLMVQNDDIIIIDGTWYYPDVTKGAVFGDDDRCLIHLRYKLFKFFI